MLFIKFITLTDIEFIDNKMKTMTAFNHSEHDY